MTDSKIIKPILLAALIVGIASYMAYYSDPLLAGFLVTIPVALPSMWFLEKEDFSKDYAWAFFLGILSYTIAAAIYYYLISYGKTTRKHAIIYSMIIWLCTSVLFYMFISQRSPHHK